jgi:hypothetical protein
VLSEPEVDLSESDLLQFFYRYQRLVHTGSSFSGHRRSTAAIMNRPETAGRWRLGWLAAAGMTKEAALLLFDSVPVTVSTICRISFVWAQARIEAE